MDLPEDRRRVALVGRSGAESTLRSVENIELLRARTATDAIGEIALAQDEGHDIEAVLIGQGALESDEIADFEKAARMLSPKVRTIDIAHLDGASALDRLNEFAEPCDAVSDTASDNVSAVSSPVEVAATSAPTITPPEEPASPHSPRLDRDALTNAILSGVDPTSIFLESVRRDTGDPTICFEKKRCELSSDSDAATRTAVERTGVVFGSLAAQRTRPDELKPLAHELASWLALHTQQRQLHRAAFTDPLTGAWNRRYFDYFLPRTLDRARAHRQDVTLMMYDIDNFKSYNDRFGHAAGDNILCETVRLLLSVIRPTDRVCRLGGDEFVVIFDDPTGPRQGDGHHPKAIVAIAGRFQKQICEHRFPKLAEQAPGTLTISGGMATFPWDGSNAVELLRRADDLALQSKKQGKNLITFGPGFQEVCSPPTPEP